jgi:hypothetical protein
MLALNDPTWREFDGGYRRPYDASIALTRMESGENVWDELWQELHHQGDVGVASYAAIPQLVRISSKRDQRDWNLYALTSTIEIERRRKINPPIPDSLSFSYHSAWTQLIELALKDLAGKPDTLTLRSALSVVALGRGDFQLGALLNDIDTDEISAYVEEHLAWSKLYST